MSSVASYPMACPIRERKKKKQVKLSGLDIPFTTDELASEEWRAIKGAPDYAVSNLGRVKRTTRGRGTVQGYVSKISTDLYGRVVFNLRRGGKRIQIKVHVAVAEAFIGLRPPGHEVAHNDGNHRNNRLHNLRWATSLENQADKEIHGTQPKGESVWCAVLTEDRVRMMRARRPLSYEKIAKEFGVGIITAYNAINGRTWKHVK